MFKRILVPYDGSELSEKAISQAIELSKINPGSDVTLFHVVEEFPIPEAAGLYTRIKSTKTGDEISLSDHLKEIYQKLKSNMSSELDKKKKQNKESGTIYSRVEIGSPADKVLEFVNRENIDLVVMGSKKKKGISKYVKSLGSVTRKVSENADCQVLIVK